MAFVAKINAHDVDDLVALMTPEHLFVDALNNSFRGAEQMRQGWKFYFGMFPDYAIEVTTNSITASWSRCSEKRTARSPSMANSPEKTSGKFQLRGEPW